jgi:hypothetical protein
LRGEGKRSGTEDGCKAEGNTEEDHNKKEVGGHADGNADRR